MAGQIRNHALKERILEIRKLYPTMRSVILPALYAAQEEYGWLSAEAIEEVSLATGIPAAEIKGTATFYAMYRNEPKGRHIVQLCTNVTCLITGAEDLLEMLRQEYGLVPGGTTKDGRFSLVIMECIGACGTAPAMMVNTDAYDSLTKDSMRDILQRYP